MCVLYERREAELFVNKKNHIGNRELQPKVSSHSRWGSKKKGKPVLRALGNPDALTAQPDEEKKRLKGKMEKAFFFLFFFFSTMTFISFFDSFFDFSCAALGEM